MAKINTSPLSGMRDFLPLDVLRRNYVINIIEQIYQSYGFEPLETPTMERLSTLLGKYGEEGDQLIFRVMKRGDKLEKALNNIATSYRASSNAIKFNPSIEPTVQPEGATGNFINVISTWLVLTVRRWRLRYWRQDRRFCKRWALTKSRILLPFGSITEAFCAVSWKWLALPPS